ncbi:hypothetical protein KIL84_019337 [Mauremys mutica]|uniref:Uncharacterized protein n=1 Tax=Mauremys mutica TaxID=74926 RepID=A0A9D3XUX3_9SAUR|nr:hypothetical protein KIL84_019337 [Mauremys mutica]
MQLLYFLGFFRLDSLPTYEKLLLLKRCLWIPFAFCFPRTVHWLDLPIQLKRTHLVPVGTHQTTSELAGEYYYRAEPTVLEKPTNIVPVAIDSHPLKTVTKPYPVTKP